MTENDETIEPAIESADLVERGETVPLGGVLARIQVHEPAFTAVERRIAAAIRNNGRELVGLPVDELAARLEVSPASVARFCRRLGYRGLRELMLALAAEVLSDTLPVVSPILPEDNVEAIVRKVTSAAQQALAASADVLDRGALDQVIEELVNAGRVQLFGVGGSAAIAQDAYYRFARLGLPVSVATDAHLQPVIAANLEPTDLAFVISHTGRSREPVEVLEQAKSAGATTILLTSFANTPAAHWADIVLLTAPVATAPWDGMAPLRVAQLTVIDMLCVAVAAREDQARHEGRARRASLIERAVPTNRNEVGPARATTIVSSENGVHAPEPAASSPANQAEPSERDQRRVIIDGVRNARHMGGFRLPDGRRTAPVVFRSGMLWQITPTGIKQLRQLGITDIVDLRRDDDLRYYPSPNLGAAGFTITRAPMYEHPGSSAPDLDDRAGWVSYYRAWVEGSQPAMRTLLETIHNAKGNVLMHCILGEDRTGIATALLLDLLGVSEAEIKADYGASPNGPGWEFLVSAALERVREGWGSTGGYFVDAGTGKLVLSRARARLEGRDVF